MPNNNPVPCPAADGDSTVTAADPSTSDHDAIKTIAFFDLETSGLPQYEFNRTKITELSLIACSVEHIRWGRPPRVQHKLSLCLNPFRMIDPESTRITGLDNLVLEHEQTFDANAGEMLAAFMRRLQAPVCLVAHNGDGFDFPLLRKELDRVGVQLPENVRCADSLGIFRKIDQIQQLQATRERETAAQAQSSLPANNDDSSIASTDAASLLSCLIARDARTDWRKLNETTPQRCPAPVVASGGQQSTPVSTSSTSVTTPTSSKRKLSFDAHRGASAKKRFRLVDVYERLFDALPEQSHCAEADTVALLRCVCAARESFLALIDAESRPWADVRPMGK